MGRGDSTCGPRVNTRSFYSFVILFMKSKQPRAIQIADYHFLPIFNRPTVFFSFAHLKADKGCRRLVIIKATFFCVHLTTGREKKPIKGVRAYLLAIYGWCINYGGKDTMKLLLAFRKVFFFSIYVAQWIRDWTIDYWNAIIGICIGRELSFRRDC